MAPYHEIWQRCRRSHHGGATRTYAKPPSPQYGRTSPVYCEHCTTGTVDSGNRRIEGGESPLIRGEDPVPKFDLLDEIDFSTGVAGSKFCVS